MARLPTAPARLTVPRPALMAPKDEAGRTQYRREVTPWRKWYDTARWKRLRWSVLLRDLFTCQMCKRTEGDTSQLVGDHKVPHRGDAVLFWDASNIQCLCKPCHDGRKQAMERRGER